ncbi:cupin domain-containing protein [Flavobacterium sp.]|uniref:cupin domain-containing protein n=1 Tax=Flavobacterium sp. TaxID=239 RepID=UPI003D6AD51F
MKVIKLISKIFLVGLFLMLCSNTYAQDPVMAAPNVYKKILLNNEKVRVIQIEFAPGDVAVWHHHPDHVACALTDGKIEITDKGKAPVAIDLKEGDALFIPAVTHMAKNIGTTTIRMVVTEIKHGKSKK